MVEFDDKREQVIKRCRDVQKLSKQSIFSLHRGQMVKARSSLRLPQRRHALFLQSFPSSVSHPSEVAAFATHWKNGWEGRLFEAWLLSGNQTILSMSQMSAELKSPLFITAEEYLGGLVDFTGELGRWAVLKATSRDRAAVEKALSADLLVEASSFILEQACQVA